MTDKRVLERDRFAVLVHVYTLRQATFHSSISKRRIMKDLGLSEKRTDQLVATLMRIGFLEWGTGDGVKLTENGVDYIERRARRRRSVRIDSGDMETRAR